MIGVDLKWSSSGTHGVRLERRGHTSMCISQLYHVENGEAGAKRGSAVD